MLRKKVICEILLLFAVFAQAKDLGISFIVLAGGEPMIREDVIVKASQFKEILFPIFTNGTYIDEDYLKLFDKNRNLLPIMSIEGEKDNTDTRRGKGIYDILIKNMDRLHERGIIFGASLTVTTQNINEVTTDSFLKSLSDRGCKAVIFVEYVPVTDESEELAPGDKEREYLSSEISRLRNDSGGCVAAGRGFFHINSHGGAEPCPFSPYSDVNIRNTSLRDALKSPLFVALREGDILKDDHEGGCVLYEKRQLVEELIKRSLQ